MERLEVIQGLKLKGNQLQFMRDTIERRGLTIAAVAAESGILPNNISATLSGARAPTEATLRAICEAIGLRCTIRLEVGIHL